MFVNSLTFVNAVKTTSMSMKKISEELIHYITFFKNTMTILITVEAKTRIYTQTLNKICFKHSNVKLFVYWFKKVQHFVETSQTYLIYDYFKESNYQIYNRQRNVLNLSYV